MSYTEDINTLVSNFNTLYDTAPYQRRGSTSINYNAKVMTHEQCCKAITNTGIKMSNPYHAYGIGNNNEYKLFRVKTDEDGYKTEQIVGKLVYNYGLYHKEAYIYLYDKDEKQIWRAPEGMKLASDNERW